MIFCLRTGSCPWRAYRRIVCCAVILVLSSQCAEEPIENLDGFATTTNLTEELPLEIGNYDDPTLAANVIEAPPVQEVAIEQGVVEVFSRADRIAPLQIITPEGDTSYFVKLVDADSSAAIMTMFIRGGQTFETQVPLGRIRVRFATGTVWQGTEQLFGRETAFQEADRTLDFATDFRRCERLHDQTHPPNSWQSGDSPDRQGGFLIPAAAGFRRRHRLLKRVQDCDFAHCPIY